MAERIQIDAMPLAEVQSFISDLLDMIKGFDEEMLKNWLSATYPEISGID